MKPIPLFAIFTFLTLAAVSGIGMEAPDPAELPGNFHQVSDDVFRSSQPDRGEFRALAASGVKSILNLREYHSDRSAIRKLGLTEYRVPVAAGKMSEADLVEALTVLRDAPRPVLIHCWHGSDRTGTVVAAYRIVFEDWPVEKAIDEMEREEFGFHARVYPNLPELLRGIDWNELRRKLLPEPEEKDGEEQAAA